MTSDGEYEWYDMPSPHSGKLRTRSHTDATTLHLLCNRCAQGQNLGHDKWKRLADLLAAADHRSVTISEIRKMATESATGTHRRKRP